MFSHLVFATTTPAYQSIPHFFTYLIHKQLEFAKFNPLSCSLTLLFWYNSISLKFDVPTTSTTSFFLQGLRPQGCRRPCHWAVHVCGMGDPVLQPPVTAAYPLEICKQYQYHWPCSPDREGSHSSPWSGPTFWAPHTSSTATPPGCPTGCRTTSRATCTLRPKGDQVARTKLCYPILILKKVN